MAPKQVKKKEPYEGLRVYDAPQKVSPKEQTAALSTRTWVKLFAKSLAQQLLLHQWPVPNGLMEACSWNKGFRMVFFGDHLPVKKQRGSAVFGSSIFLSSLYF